MLSISPRESVWGGKVFPRGHISQRSFPVTALNPDYNMATVCPYGASNGAEPRIWTKRPPFCFAKILAVPTIVYTPSNIKKLKHKRIIIIPSAQRSCWWGVYCIGFTPSVRPASRVRSVMPTVLVGSISYLHILSSNFRRCVACNISCKFEWQFLAIFLNL